MIKHFLTLIRKTPSPITVGAIFMIICNFSIAQSTVSGSVYDAKSKQTLVGASVYISDLNKGVTTNKEGQYQLVDIPKGSHLLQVRFQGYKTWESKINIKDSLFRLNVHMKPDTLTLVPTIISGERVQIPFTVSKTTIMQEELEQAAVRDIGDYLRYMPNFGGVRKGGAAIDPVLRGFRFHQLNVRMDGGIRIEGGCPNRMDPTTAHVENEDIEKVEIINGPHALKYGPAFGGYINLITSKPTPFESSKFQVKGKAIIGYESNWPGNKQFFSLKAGNDKVYTNFTAGFRDYGNYKDGNGNVVESELRKYTYSAEAGFKLAPKHKLILSYKGSHGRDVAYPALPMDERIDDTRVVYAQYNGMKLSKRVMGIQVRVFNSTVLHIMDNAQKPTSDTVFASSNVDAIVTGFAAGTKIKLNKKSMLMVGLGFETTYKLGIRTKTMLAQRPIGYQVPIKEEVLMDARINNGGGVLEYTSKFGKLDFVAAARLDINTASSADIYIEDKTGNPAYMNDDVGSQYVNFSASVGVKRKLSENWIFGLALGRGVRSPNMIERYIRLLPVGFDNFDYLGNPQVKPETNNQIDLSIQYNVKFGSFQLNGFYSYVQDYISAKVLPPSEILPNTTYVIGVKQFYNEDYALFRGFEFTYSSPERYKLLAQIMASYTYATNPNAAGYTTNASGKPNGVQYVKNDAIPEIPPFEASFLLDYRLLNKKLKAGMMIRFVAAQDYVSEAMHENTTPGFTLVNLHASYSLFSNLTVTAGVNNLFDLAYYEHLNRRILGTSMNLYEPGRVIYINLIFKI